jgi:hypothetical protein
VRHDLPNLNQDLTDQNDWERSMHNACREVHQPDNCLQVTYQVRRRDASGRFTPIPNPGPNYLEGDEPEYAHCRIDRINPPTGKNQRIPAGSRVTISITCDPRDTEESTPASPSSGPSHRPTGSGH